MITKEKGCVYFFKHTGLEPIKIGYSSNISPIARFEQFKTYAPFGAELIGFIQSFEPKKLETKLHKRYKLNRLKGEWFNISLKDVKSEIKFHTNIEDAKEENNFQIAWARSLEKKSPFSITLEDEFVSFMDTLPVDKTPIPIIKTRKEINYLHPEMKKSFTAQNFNKKVIKFCKLRSYILEVRRYEGQRSYYICENKLIKKLK
jgi:hypothetical protein